MAREPSRRRSTSCIGRRDYITPIVELSHHLDAPLADSKELYQYQNLNGVDEFRLLILSPGSLNDALHGEVITAKFSGTGRPAYEALSYTWADETGDDKRSSELLCDEDHSIIRITKNCEAAMCRLRLLDKKRWLWIDAVCINQSSDAERTYQISVMAKIYRAASGVVVYTGDGTSYTDGFFDWLNGLQTKDLDILLKWDLDSLTVDTAISFEKYWIVGKERLLAAFSNPGENKINISQPEFVELAEEFFSRRWFKRVWVLQEVSLPDVRNITVMCGAKTTTAIRALHALSLIHNDSSGTMTRIFVLLRKKVKVKKSHLLDILIETRHRDAGDPRDKIFGVLSIVNHLDKGMIPKLKAEYEMTTTEVYAYYSAFFIQHHGPGFFLSLIKSPPKLTPLPSWAADWTVPWPNYKAVEGRDFAATSRPSNDRDSGAVFITENGFHVLILHRPKILQGYFTRNGHIDDEKNMCIEGLEHLREGEVLIEIYPGLAALLRQENTYHVFTQVCPHALSEGGVEELVGRWIKVVVDGEGLKDSRSSEYLGSVEPFKIR